MYMYNPSGWMKRYVCASELSNTGNTSTGSFCLVSSL